MAKLAKKSAAGVATGGKDAPTNVFSVDENGAFTTNTGNILGTIYVDAGLQTLVPAQSNLIVAKLEKVVGSGLLKVSGSNGRVVGYAVGPDEDETDVDAWFLETITRHGHLYTYVITGFSEAYAGLGNERGEPRSIRKYVSQPNDTLVKIAQNFLYDARRWRELYELNRVSIGSDPTVLKFGTVLRMPRR